MELVIREKTYYSQADEKAFFDRLKGLSCVASLKGDSNGLHVRLRRKPSNSDLRELIALLYRYGLDMKALSALKTTRNSSWFSDPKMFWHKAIFGK